METTAVDNLSVDAALLERYRASLPSFVKPMFAEPISIDHGVMERSDRAAMLPAPFSWSDIGSWDAVAELWPEDTSSNRSRDRVISVDSSGNVVAAGKPVALLGVKDLVVVDSGDALLICPRDRAQDVRKIVDALRAGDMDDLL